MKYERGWHIEATPTSALDQWELLVQSGLQSADDTFAEFEQHIVPYLGAADNLARLLCKMLTRPRILYRGIPSSPSKLCWIPRRECPCLDPQDCAQLPLQLA